MCEAFTALHGLRGLYHDIAFFEEELQLAHEDYIVLHRLDVEFLLVRNNEWMILYTYPLGLSLSLAHNFLSNSYIFLHAKHVGQDFPLLLSICQH